MKFIKSNPHPNGKKIGDCVVRAISIAETKKWIDVYDDLYKIGRELFVLPNDKHSYEKYLIDNGWIKQRMPKYPSGKRYRLKELADENIEGIMIVSLNKHLATIVDGNLYDTWDCSHKAVGNYFIK